MLPPPPAGRCPRSSPRAGQLIKPEWKPKESRTMPSAKERWRTSGPFVNFLPVDVWRTIALMAGPEGSLAMWVMCFPSRAGLVSIAARIHRVRWYLTPRQRGVAIKEEYYHWDKTAVGHQAREAPVQRIRSGKRKPSPGWVEWTVCASR